MAGGILQLRLELLRLLIEVDFGKQSLNRFGAHAGFEIVLIFFAHIAVFFFVEHLLFLQFAHIARVGDDIQGKVQHLLQHAGRDVENQAHAGRNALEVPDVGDGRGQLNVAHALAANLCGGHFNTAAFADFTLVTNSFVFSAVALPVLLRPKDSFAEQSVAFGFQGAVVDRFGLFYLAVRPCADGIRRSQADLH